MRLWLAALWVAGCGRHGFPEESDAASSDPLVVHLEMDDDPADGAHDSSAYRHDALCTSCPAPLVARGSGVFRFAGAESLEIAYDTTLAPVPGVTAAAWIQVTSFVGTRCVISKPVGSAVANSWQLCLDSDLAIKGCFGYPGIPPATGCPEAAGAIQPATWHHVALTYDGDMGRVYVDGVMVIEGQFPIAHDDRPLVIGGDIDDGAPDALFVGLLDEVRVYNVALSIDEIASLAVR